MKIGVLCYPTYGGSGVVATELGRAMARRGHEIHFINHQLPVRLHGDGFSENIYFHEVAVPNYPLFVHPPWTMALAGRVVQVIREYGLDLLHAHYAVPHSLVAVLARQVAGNVGVVTTLHGTDITLVGVEPDFLEVTRYAIESSDAVTAVSHALARETAERLTIEKSIHTVYNFVDLEDFSRQEDNPRDHYAQAGQAVLTHVSNFRPVKRLLDVVEIFARVRSQRPAVLLLVGDGPDRCPALCRAKELGIAEDIRLLGQQQQIVQILSASDLLLLPSEKESFGLVALEAMACGVPVVGSNVGGLPEVIEGKGGILCPVGAVDDMAAAALRILDDLPAWRLISREQAHKFSEERWVNEYEEIYKQVIAK